MKGLLRLYPRSFRERYGDELAALVTAEGPGVAVALDLLRGAIDAHLQVLRGRGTMKRTFGLVFSIAVHVAVIAALVGWKYWSVEEMPTPAHQLILWVACPPPPAPAPPKLGRPDGGASRHKAIAQLVVHEVVAPQPAPQAIDEPPAPTDEGPGTGPIGDPKGVENGKPNGIPGGTGDCDGCVGTSGRPTILPEQTAAAQRISGQNPMYTQAAKSAGVQGTVVTKICVAPSGSVSSVSILQGLPQLDDEVVRTVSGWRYRPFLYNGQPIPFCYPARFVFTLR